MNSIGRKGCKKILRISSHHFSKSDCLTITGPRIEVIHLIKSFQRESSSSHGQEGPNTVGRRLLGRAKP